MDISKSIRMGLAVDGKRQNWLAEQLAVSDNYVSCICKGDKQISLIRLEQISSVFNVPVSTFIKWGEE